MTNLGRELKRKRSELKLSQKLAAGRCELEQSVFSRIESGIVKCPSDETYEKLAKGLGITVETLRALAEEIHEDLATPILRIGFPHSLTVAPIASLVMRPIKKPWKLTSFGTLGTKFSADPPHWHDFTSDRQLFKTGPRFTKKQKLPDSNDGQEYSTPELAEVRPYTARHLMRLAGDGQIDCLVAASSALKTLDDSQNALRCARITTAYGHGSLLLAGKGLAGKKNEGNYLNLKKPRPDLCPAWQLITEQTNLVTFYGKETIAERNVYDLPPDKRADLNPQAIDVANWPEALKVMMKALRSGKQILFIAWDPLIASLREAVIDENIDGHWALYLTPDERHRYATYDFMMVNTNHRTTVQLSEQITGFLHALRGSISKLNQAIEESNPNSEVIADVAAYFGMGAEECLSRIAMMRYDMLYYPKWTGDLLEVQKDISKE